MDDVEVYKTSRPSPGKEVDIYSTSSSVLGPLASLPATRHALGDSGGGWRKESGGRVVGRGKVYPMEAPGHYGPVMKAEGGLEGGRVRGDIGG